MATELETLKTIILFVLCIFTFNNAIAALSSSEKQALLDLYQTTNGDDWTASWDLTTSVENWKGVTIIDNNVSKEISKIESLEHFDIYANDFTGSLPTEINQLPNLRRIRMYATHLKTNTTNTFAITY